ncbi:MAG: hypothetical protein M3O50_22305, partial [Myxococcota bacterium]|nr:hypothetical protein [Myxococcota bacterium]
YVSFAAPLPRVEKRKDYLVRAAAAQEAAVVVELDRIDRALVTGELREFEEIHRAKPSWVFKAAQSALGVLVRPRRLG